MRLALAAVGTVGVVVALSLWALGPKAEGTQQASSRAERATLQADSVARLTIEGMTCGGCAAAVSMAAHGIDGVKAATVSYEEGTAEITYDASKMTPEAIARTVSEQSGFKARVAKGPTP
ncbi:MAG: heavy-metal-associated domain-containing protein [Vicinamibacteraceae bacterium]